MQIIEIIGDVRQAKRELAALTDLDPARLKLCTTAIHDLEETLEELITLPWIPRTLAGLDGSISSVLHNIRRTEKLVDDWVYEIWQRQLPDEVLRMDITLIVLDALKFQLNVLIEARLHMLRSTLENIEELVN
jgi:hypothetical protein